ncbi:MAG: tRNA pseudouridine(55) synthase TruB [Acidimicrobiales bacterium]
MAKNSQGLSGIAVVDKPAGWTSHDVVAKSRGVFKTRKVGHSGTLDPDATGVLILGVGKATRLLRFLDVATKSYTGEIVFGTETNTLDSSGDVTASHDMGPIDLEAARAAAATLSGEIDQIPPMVSAKKVDGKRLHELAREGVEIEREAATVVVHRFDLESTDDPMVIRCEVDCSTGTYIRSLAADLGAALGGGAHLRNLRRTGIGSFTVDQAAPLEQVELRPIVDIVAHLDPVTVDAATAIDVAYGKVLSIDRIGTGASAPYPLVDESGELLAVYEDYKAGTIKPAVVLAEPPPKPHPPATEPPEDESC